MYPIVLALHSWVRWLVVIAGLAALVWAVAGGAGRRSWARTDATVMRLFATSLEVQLLLGVLLYAFSPITRAALSNFGSAMANSVVRFFSLEHVVAMVFALAVLHMGRVLVRRQPDGAPRQRLSVACYLVALAIILAAVPWPFTGVGDGRPWLRL